MKKILMIVGWGVKRVKEDDKSKHPADILLPQQKYWFFKHWPEDNLKIEVIGYKKNFLLSIIERKILHFHLFQSLRILARMRKYDLLIFFHSQIGIIPALFKSVFKIKTPLVLIDVEGLGRKNKWYVLPFIRKAISAVNHLLYFATIQKEDYARYLPKLLPKSDFIPLGLDLSRFSCNEDKEEDYIVSIGYQGSNFRDWKSLIKAYSQLNTKTKLLILGKEKFEKEDIGEEKIPAGIEFIGKTNLATLNEITSKAKFVVLSLPERRHAFAQMTLLGVMALGKPVIVTENSGVINYVSNGETALLSPVGDAEELGAKMRLLLADKELREKLGKNAKDSVQNKFSEQIMAEKMWGILKNRGLLEESGFSTGFRTAPSSKNILLLGFGFCLQRISADKNFWLELSKELSSEVNRLVVVSVNSSPIRFQQEKNIWLYNIQRPFHKTKDEGKILRFQFQRHPLYWEILERSATLLKLIPFLRKLARLHNIEAIHLMDNFGCSTGLLKLFFPKVKIYATAITYNSHSLPAELYSFYQRIVFGNLDKVVVSSQAYREKLLARGFPKEKVKVIHWGVPVENSKENLLLKTKKNSSKKVILWSGFTQQIKEESFYHSLSLAQKITKKNPAVEFIFAFKPECFQSKYKAFQGKNLRIVSTTPQSFARILEQTDLLLAPVENQKSTIAPPLTWIECMALGIPIMSTQAPGVNEVLKHNLTGFVAKSNEELEAAVEKVLEEEKHLSEVSQKAKEWVKENYSLKDISQNYLRLWRKDGNAILPS
jgi:glycosyltransferase involved in cell wall biosynthesis